MASIAPLAAWCRAVGGARVSVTQLVPAGHDPRTYTLTAADRKQLIQADVVLLNGQGLEPWLETFLAGKSFRQAIIVDVAEWIWPSDEPVLPQRAPLPLNPDGSNDPRAQQQPGDPALQLLAAHSPYQWLNPAMARQAVTIIAQNLTRADPDGLLLYRQNAAAYNAEIENLDGTIQRTIDQLSQRQFEDPHGFMEAFRNHFKWNNPTRAFATGTHNQPLILVDALNPGPTGEYTLQLQHGKGRIDPLNNDNYLVLMRTVTQQLTQTLQP